MGDFSRLQEEISGHTDTLRQLEVTSDDEESTQILASALIGRAVASLDLAEGVLATPASSSERQPMFGTDPLFLAERARGDAEKLLAAGVIEEGHLLKGRALSILSLPREAVVEISKAREACGGDEQWRKLVDELHAEKQVTLVEEGSRSATADSVDGSSEKKRRIVRGDDLDCPMCCRLLLDPVTTPCGHTFCRTCLVRAVDHSCHCPMCRAVVYVNAYQLPTTVVLRSIIEKNFAEELKKRKEEDKAEKDMQVGEGSVRLPLFVMDAVLPGEQIDLNIFEPRYRLMIRRCLEGSGKFGMILAVDGEVMEGAVGTEVKVKEYETQSDGRFLVTVIGERRFKCEQLGEQDGVRVASCSFLVDDLCEGEERTEAKRELETAERKLNEQLESLKSEGGRLAAIAHMIKQRAGKTPSEDNITARSFWLASHLSLPSEDKVKLLSDTSVRSRAAFLVQWLEGSGLVRQIGGGGCTIQ
mmetsp:Transcript_36360/g.94567  ORF Transcript_36360/g.94567 Transcript_36360/m.94567 type:complete len:473 (-) Transcript_36360:1799-3217(-)